MHKIVFSSIVCSDRQRLYTESKWSVLGGQLGDVLYLILENNSLKLTLLPWHWFSTTTLQGNP